MDRVEGAERGGKGVGCPLEDYGVDRNQMEGRESVGDVRSLTR